MPPSMLSSLLILPPPPSPSDPALLKAAYGPSLKAALTTLASTTDNKTGLLYIGLPCSLSPSRLRLPRSQLFHELSHAVAALYSLACVIAAEANIAGDGPNGVDVRVLPLSYEETQRFESDETLSELARSTCGPVIDLPTLARTRRQWRYVFQIDGEPGLSMYSTYMNLAARMSPPVKGEIKTISGGVCMVTQEAAAIPPPEQLARVHTVVAVGGTFDHLHDGHKLLLTATALLLQPASKQDNAPRRLIIGITGDELLKNKKYSEFLESWKERQDGVVEFLQSILSFRPAGYDNPEVTYFDKPVVNGKAIHTKFPGSQIVIECVEIQDPFGPTITEEAISALAVSAETRSGGAAVNSKRQEKGWKDLEIFEVDVLDAGNGVSGPSTTENFDSKISSTAIRKRKAESKQSLL